MLLSVSFLVPPSHAHPDILQASFENRDGTIPDITVMYLKDTQEKDDDIEYEFFTQEWFSQNIILLLSGIISISVGITVLMNFREEIFLRQDKRAN